MLDNNHNISTIKGVLKESNNAGITVQEFRKKLSSFVSNLRRSVATGFNIDVEAKRYFHTLEQFANQLGISISENTRKEIQILIKKSLLVAAVEAADSNGVDIENTDLAEILNKLGISYADFLFYYNGDKNIEIQ